MAQSWRAQEGIAGNGLTQRLVQTMMCRRESGERSEQRYPATLDPMDVNRFAVRES